MSKGKTLTGDRLHIALFGRRNAGKSSLINSLSGQPVAIVSDVPGTTTDPVFKSMEIHPLGPVVWIDTAGFDDLDDRLGEERKKRARNILERTDFALIVVEADGTDFSEEEQWLEILKQRSIPFLLVVNKTDLGLSRELSTWITGREHLKVSALNGSGMEELKEALRDKAPREWEPPFLRDLVRPGDVVVLVAPMDLGAPKGRLIMPQVKALRDILDGDAISLMCKERELPRAMKRLASPPALVVTDSQVFPQVAADVPSEIPLTSFSILSIRQKGDLRCMVEGLMHVPELKRGDAVLIAESCSHHPLEDDIGRVKIPRWLDQHVGGGLQIDVRPGSAYPEDLSRYKLVVHCGACTLNRREMLHRQELPAKEGVAMTNYGLLIAYLKGVFPRALSPFPEMARLFSSCAVLPEMKWRRRQARFTEF